MQATIKMDRNGNKTLRIKRLRIQTNGNLPLCHRLDLGRVELTERQALEVGLHVYGHGTTKQQKAFDRI